MNALVDPAGGRSGLLLEKLMAAVRPEFRMPIYVPAPGDPALGGAECAVGGCDRMASTERGLCNAHAIRWRKRADPSWSSSWPIQGQLCGAATSCRSAPCPAAATASPARGCAAGITTGRWRGPARHRQLDRRRGERRHLTHRMPDAVLRLVDRERHEGLLQEPRLPLAHGGRPQPRRVRGGRPAHRHRAHRSTRNQPSTGPGGPVRVAMPPRRLVPDHAAQAVRDAIRQARGGRGRLAARQHRAAVASGGPLAAASTRAVHHRCPRRRRDAARWNRVGGRVPARCLAAAANCRHHHRSRPVMSSPQAAVRPGHPTLAPAAGQTLAAAAAVVRVGVAWTCRTSTRGSASASS